MSTGTHFSKAQWALIEPLLPSSNKMGRPRANDRQTLEATLWIDRTGARWQDLPTEYGDDSTANRRLHKWQKAGIWQTIWQAGLRILHQHGQLDLSQTNIDATFAPAKAGGNTRKGKGTKIEIVSEGHSIPISLIVASANEAKITLAETTVRAIRIPMARGRPKTRPKLVCGDRAYDSQAFRRKLEQRGSKSAIPERTSSQRKRRKLGPKPLLGLATLDEC